MKAHRGRNGEAERGQEVELVYVDVERVDERADGNDEVCRRCGRDWSGLGGRKMGEVIDTSLSRGILTAGFSM